MLPSGLPLEIPERVALLDIEPARAAQLHHAVVGVDAAGADAVLPQQLEQLAAAAADVNDIRCRRQQRHVVLEPRADIVLRSAKAILEADVGERADVVAERTVGWERSDRWPGRFRRRRRRGAAGSRQLALHLPLQREHPLLGERDALAQLVAAAAAILGVDVDGDRLQVLNQQRLEPDQRVELAPRRLEQPPRSPAVRPGAPRRCG